MAMKDAVGGIGSLLQLCRCGMELEVASLRFPGQSVRDETFDLIVALMTTGECRSGTL